MRSTALFAMLAVGASVVTASDTVVYTSKTTRVMTVTHCAETYTDCPLNKTPAATATPASSSSSSTAAAPPVPTAPVVGTGYTTASGAPTGTGVVPRPSTTGPVLVPTGAANGLRAQNVAAAAAAAAALMAMAY